ncbi:hypothetical protein [Kitasatospora purpeofusca]|uniref:hypothetical protein n=1 Tax=Kitasatospora purpeofusca TaxID=67352 RepID=UPI0036D2FEFA
MPAGTKVGEYPCNETNAWCSTAVAVVDPGLYARAGTATAVFSAGPWLAPDDLPAGDGAWPVVLAPPPKEARAPRP